MLRPRSALAFAAAAALVAAACGDTSTTTPSATTTTTPPPATTAAATSTTAPTANAGVVYLARGEKLASVARAVPGQDVAGALNTLMAGATGAESAAGFTSAIPAGTRVNKVTVAGDLATVDLSKEFASGGGSLSMMLRVAQVTYTATAVPGVQRVKYQIDGQDVIALGGEGLVLTAPQTRRDLEDVQPPILVEAPAFGAVVPRSFVASGTSNTFEATHQLEVLDAKGTKVVDTFVTATSGTGERGTWQKPVELPAGAAGTFTVRVFESSAKDGSPIGLVDIPITVR
jgi:hypothetical protein